jgi:metal-responsive CopG/Arc/MetJ family transcriptional regulator
MRVNTLWHMENRKPISLKLPPELLDKLDAYRKRQPHVPTRTQVIEDAIRAIIEKVKR